MFVSIDMGGTKTRVASSIDLQSTYKVEKFYTEDDFIKQKIVLLENVVKVTEGEDISGICLGIPAILDFKTKSFKTVPNIPYLEGKAFDSFFVDADLNSKIVVENDAALAGLAEATLGSGKDFDVVAYITLSTGVGGALIEGKQLSKYQKSYEPGHQIINMDSALVDEVGIRGSLERYTSGAFFKSNYGMNAEDCNDFKIWEDYAVKLSRGLVNVISLWSPEVIVLGGSLVNKFEHFYPTLKKELFSYENLKLPEIKKSKLMDDAGLYGGFVLLSQTQFF